MSFMADLQKILGENNDLQRTENGAVGYKTTKHKLLDMNFNVPKYRAATESEIIKDFREAYAEDSILSVLWAFFARDVRGGLGERRLFRIIFRDICMDDSKQDVANILIPFISEYGRWDDLVYTTIDTPAWGKAIDVIKKQLLSDVENMNVNKPISIMGKWLPSERTSSNTSKIAARKIAHSLGIPVKMYNRLLVKLRKHLDVVEVKMSAREWSNIDYSIVPSYANLKYNNAFLRNDEPRRREYLSELSNGKTKINASTAFPHDIVRKYNIASYRQFPYTKKDEAIEGMWKALPDMGGLDNTIVVADGSGSMYTSFSNNKAKPIDVANALAIYCAEHCKGEFHNKYITFSATPKFVDFSESDGSLFGKLEIAVTNSEVANTNIERVFDVILDTAVSTNAKQEDIPASVLIISDMEFDDCVGFYDKAKTTQSHQSDLYSGSYYSFKKADAALFNVIKERFEKAGYKMPRLAFWNVASRTGTIPIRENDLGVTLISGYSVALFKMIKDGETDPYQNLKNTLMSERYAPIYRSLTESK